MNPPKTALDICNLALAKLGEEPIRGIDSCGNLAQRLCSQLYHPARRIVLCEAPWDFATAAAALQARNKPLNGVDYRFDLPQDALRILNMADDWILNGRTIIAPTPTITLLYTADCEAVDTFSYVFTAAFVTQLAKRLCIPLLNSTNCYDTLAAEYTFIIEQANAKTAKA